MYKPQNTILIVSLLSLMAASPVRALETESQPFDESDVSRVQRMGLTAQSTVTEVTAVQINSTAEGIEVILETPNGQLELDEPRRSGNTLIFNIPNAVLSEPDLRQDNPVEGITAVTVSQLEKNQIRVSVTGTEAIPTALDLTGPLTEDASLRYRLNIAYENSGSYRDFVENESIFIAPVLTWEISPQTTLTAEFEYQNYEYVFDRGFRSEPEFLELPRDRFLGEPNFSSETLNSYSASYRLEHEFSDNWKLRHGFTALIVDEPLLQEVNLQSLAADGRTLPRAATRSESTQENFTVQNDLIGEFQTGPIKHQVLVGVELSRNRLAYEFFRAPLASIDIFNPVYGAEPGQFEPNFANEQGARSIGLYAQDLIEISPQLNLLAGVRFDWSDIFYNDLFTGEELNDFTESAVSPRVGIVYQPTDSTSIYGNWARSFNPQFFGRSRTGEAFEAQQGEQFEIGVRQEFFDNRYCPQQSCPLDADNC